MPVAPTTGAVWTVVVAGGGGTRFGGAKQYTELAGRRVLDWSVAAAVGVSDGVVVVLPTADTDDPGHTVPGVDAVVAGGATRAESVRAGLAAVPDAVQIVLVHDAARPAASSALFARVVAAVADGADAVVPGVAVTDTLRRRTGGVVDRDELVAVQTPQGFRRAVLRSAHASGADATDDATLAEQVGFTVDVVEGEATNTKLTHAADAAALDSVLASRAGVAAPGGTS
ncbi:MAG: 2-C-methyl-D-erythritol 4-phosphate cytidylyltransferase [Acidimicrobiales bacterium]|nr:2-C-methyl-D-erythritol 4-phosphate cytidylyltransferase [Acidimicrobiales bacterium]